MTDMVGMKLVFRLGGYGFALPVDDLAEILSTDGQALKPWEGDSDNGIAGELEWRDKAVSVYDFQSRLGSPPTTPDRPSSVVLVLVGRQEVWGLIVDRIEGIFPAGDFAERPVPVLLQREGLQAYHQLLLWQEEPLHGCSSLELEAYCEAR